MTVLAVAVSGRGVINPHEPVLRADDDALARGRAVFETLRVYGGRPFRLEQHLERLAGSADRVGLDPPAAAELERLTRAALEAAGTPDAALRLYWTPGPPDGPPTAIAVVSSLPEELEETRARGLRVVALLCPRRAAPWLLPGTKSTSYAVNMAIDAEAKRRGVDDAVLVDADGIVLEGPVTNTWWRRGRTLFTPSLELGILAGETRAALVDLAPELGYEVDEGIYPLEALAAANEAFTSSSVREVMPIVELDRRPIARGDAAAALQAALRHLATSESDRTAATL
jgi:4-amino-4-deoxychorismate lyase